MIVPAEGPTFSSSFRYSDAYEEDEEGSSLRSELSGGRAFRCAGECFDGEDDSAGGGVCVWNSWLHSDASGPPYIGTALRRMF